MTTLESGPVISALGTPPAAGGNPSRAETRERLSKAAYDLLVIGGGILGISTAWHAAQSGLRVALVDAGDFAGATSSASSKLLHGGLRYLQTGAVKLVAENHFERRAVSRQVAPHLANPLTFYLPVYKGGPHGAAKLGAGVFAYSALSAFGDGVGHLLSPAKAAQDVPELRTDNLKAVAVYGDDQMNDARMALMTVRAAVEAGAVVLNHAEVTGLRFSNGRVTGADLKDRQSGDEFGVSARLVLNATGPWVDHLRKMEDPNAAPSIRLSKGAHLVLKRTAPWKAALATPIDKYRITFALPWEDMLLLGTTDEEYEGDPRDVSVTEQDTAQILDEAAFSIRDQQLSRDLITYSFAGLRVLPGGPGDTSKAKRETVVTEGRGGMLSIAGGKWTTFRHIGRTIMKKLESLPGHPLGDDYEPISTLPKKLPLPGIANPRAVAHRLLVDGPAPGPRMAPDTARHLATHYGSLSFDIARLANENPELAERVHPDAPEIWAQVVYARDNEWAETADDVLRRRTTLTIRGLATDEIRGKVEDLLGKKS
ncbi:glycerol-3-phosphate dehydrogenase/oxidase [Streptomyces spectabilis]|uniref:Glycerol-3-phosphate dehydrogenase n=1 Tax=Streptomyces spectabilis TaxID=68270 RepID=A0A5P2X964_STRST|nr:glycerol-3-phosphate dehydrogenase/oxidase [Streptomyces spectabilis]MBB5105968.1 glycerol-3-phosphate dehydrogenase [Streptomyces spectabilis]MCI3901500.1 glycerol-3-phosphate dehydrogenase/oxidase [Streptomyces spectabilis]QEV58962.1 glycerol-3-phosphate dehydrogenase/oxidase [Streptomyces spectabilis]GGV25143.1 glycerol-3-phosphate dehydrogenase [Streptomyces spectabilis]